MRIPYTIQDDWGNTSSGIITVEALERGNPQPGHQLTTRSNVLFTNLQSETRMLSR